MKKTVIIIPTRLGAKRFPNKPLEEINNVPMIVHVLNKAKESKIGEVFVATPDIQIVDLVEKNGGLAILTNQNHLSGSDRIYEVYEKKLKNKVDTIINLQGDMPNIKPETIVKLKKLMENNRCDIGTLASNIENKEDLSNKNIVKVSTNEKLKNDSFLVVEDFFRIKKDLNSKNIYHHCGIYSFTKDALTRYVSLSRSKLEKERNLEQMRAMENKMLIKVGLANFSPLSVDTKEDLIKIKKEMKNYE